MSKLGAVANVCVKVSAVIGKTELTLSQLVDIKEGSIIELDKKVGETVDIYVNDGLAARGKLVLAGKELGISLTEILVDGGDL